MKIYLFTDTFYDTNGTSTFIEDIARMSQLHNINLKVFFSNQKTPSSFYKNVTSVKKIAKFKMPFYPQFSLIFPSYFQIKKLLREEKPDIIHISTPGPLGFCAQRVAKKLAIPIVGTYHTNHPSYIYENTHSKFLENISKRVLINFYKDFSLVFTRSKENKKLMINDIKIDSSKIKKIPIGINLQKFNNINHGKYLIEKYKIKEKVKFLYVGRLTDEKNIKFLIDTWNELIEEKRLDAALIMVGAGKYLNYPLKNAYYFGEMQKEELLSVYTISDVFLFPSITDTLGQVVIEAQISGLPAIVSNIGGPKEIIKKEPKSGIVKKIDKEKWKKAITKLYEKKQFRKKLSKASKKKKHRYDILKSFEYFIDIHQKVLTKDKV
ncbi:glycosyltransferase [Halarcobacter sp.]|uniref:glycosyltransferase n=1 Tax=Halarcobacter sp. TaxID=2321133 RepID=UPI0029F5B9A1|nr:glycosyltransferase [Halarcobacter sp.]